MMAEYTGRSLPEKAVLSSIAPNDDRAQKAKSGRVGRKLCHSVLHSQSPSVNSDLQPKRLKRARRRFYSGALS